MVHIQSKHLQKYVLCVYLTSSHSCCGRHLIWFSIPCNKASVLHINFDHQNFRVLVVSLCQLARFYFFLSPHISWPKSITFLVEMVARVSVNVPAAFDTDVY